jgi:putative two-component system response regulator
MVVTSNSQYKILVVDDEPDLELLISQKFRRQIREGSHAFLFARSGLQALELLETHRDTDVVLTDINMPEMDGLTLLKHLARRSAIVRTVIVSAYGDLPNIRTAMNRGAFDFLTKPIDFGDLEITLEKTLEHVRERKHALRSFHENDLLKTAVAERTSELRETQDVTILCLAALAEIRDPDTGKHLERTRLYVQALADQLRQRGKHGAGLSGEVMEMLYRSTPLHDIGKVGVPDAILLKEDTLTEEEFEQMKRHTEYGSQALRWAEERLGFDSFLTMARRIALEHHERWDGSGYPQGLRGDAISIEARLMALADFYDALTTRRSYKPRFSHEKTREMILEQRGKHFDPDIVDTFLEIEDQFKYICRRYAEVDEELDDAAGSSV